MIINIIYKMHNDSSDHQNSYMSILTQKELYIIMLY